MKPTVDTPNHIYTKLFMNRLFIATAIFLVSCSSNKTETPLTDRKDSAKSFEQGLSDYITETPLTNRNTENNEWTKNVYRNKYYKFRIEFPKGWEYDDGSTKTTLARSLNRNIGATISVFVSHIADQEKPSNPNDIVVSVPLNSYTTDFNKSMALQNTKAETLKIEIGKLNNFPAYLISFTTLASSGNRSYTFLSKQIHCYQKGLLYQIALNIPIDYYNSDIELLYERTINSFNFENSY